MKTRFGSVRRRIRKSVPAFLLVVTALALGLALPSSSEAASLVQVQKLTGAAAWDSFGYSVAVSGDIAVVGAPWEDAGGVDAGAAYVFSRDQGGTDNWGEVQKLTASDAAAEDLFGYGVAVSGDIAAVGAPGDSAGGQYAGAAYVFEQQAGPAGVGGIQALPEVAASASSAADSSDSSARIYGALAGGLAAAVVAITAGTWYARRRWLR
jgi:hypothetical protein